MVLEEIIDKLEKKQSPEHKVKETSSESLFSIPNWAKLGDKPWMGYGVSFIVFGLLLMITFKYVLGFGF